MMLVQFEGKTSGVHGRSIDIASLSGYIEDPVAQSLKRITKVHSPKALGLDLDQRWEAAIGPCGDCLGGDVRGPPLR